VDGFGLGAVETDRIDGPLNGFSGKLEEPRRSVCQGEKPAAGFAGRFVFRSQAEQAGDENAEGIPVRGARDNTDDRLTPLTDLASDDLNRRMDLVRLHENRGLGLEMTMRMNRRFTQAGASRATFADDAELRAVSLSCGRSVFHSTAAVSVP
jgi:hypothetical protein